MQAYVEALKNSAEKLTDFDKLGDFVRSIDYTSLDYINFVPKLETNDNYSRNILMMHPIEVALLHWPPQVESAIHYHEGFYGYVIVLEGELNNFEYIIKNGELREASKMMGLQGGILPEQDGVIHKLVNTSKNKSAITLHIYSPPLEHFGGMKIYDVENKRIGTLSKTAQTASWQEPVTSFEHIEENAFKFIPQESQKSSHRIFSILPKPDAKTIYSMLGEYYNEQAKEYDNFDTTHYTRNAYTNSLNEIIAKEYSTRDDLEHELALACGTGRRVADIRKLSGVDYEIDGVDLSKEMCEIAAKQNINTYNCLWLDCNLPEKKYDSATFLYAFGHICSKQERIDTLKKVAKHLKEGGTFYFDVFNVNDKYEWGPKALEAFKDNHLERMGYEKGDVFYIKTGGNSVAYLHYFEENEIVELLTQCGFTISWVKHIGYTHNSGEELSEPDSGSLFIKAIKS